MRSRTPLPWVLVLLLPSCALPTFEVSPRYAVLSIEGEAALSSGGASGALDVEQAGLEDEETISGRADLKFGAPHLVVLGQAPRFEGQGTLDADIDDGVDSIPSGSAVDSRVDLGLYDGALVFDLIPGDTLELALGVGAAYLDLALAFEDGSGAVVDTEKQFGVPLLAAIASVQLGPFELGAFAGGMELTYEGDTVTYWDGDAFLRLRILGGSEHLRASLVVGYRATQVEAEYHEGGVDVDTDLRIQGPYAGLEIGL